MNYCKVKNLLVDFVLSFIVLLVGVIVGMILLALFTVTIASFFI